MSGKPLNPRKRPTKLSKRPTKSSNCPTNSGKCATNGEVSNEPPEASNKVQQLSNQLRKVCNQPRIASNQPGKFSNESREGSSQRKGFKTSMTCSTNLEKHPIIPKTNPHPINSFLSFTSMRSRGFFTPTTVIPYCSAHSESVTPSMNKR